MKPCKFLKKKISLLIGLALGTIVLSPMTLADTLTLSPDPTGLTTPTQGVYATDKNGSSYCTANCGNGPTYSILSGTAYCTSNCGNNLTYSVSGGVASCIGNNCPNNSTAQATYSSLNGFSYCTANCGTTPQYTISNGTATCTANCGSTQTTSSNSSFDSSGMISAIGGLGDKIERLGNKIEGLALAAINFVNSMTYQYNSDLPASIAANTPTTINGNVVTPATAARQIANSTTQQNVNNSLAQVAYSITPPLKSGLFSANAIAFQTYNDNNSRPRLTLNTKASDSPFFISKNQWGLDFFKPLQLLALAPASADTLSKNNLIFNFGNLIAPTVYTPDQNLAASRFVQYTTKNFEPMTTGINFKVLKNANAEQLNRLVTSDAFQSFQLNLRSTIATRSITENLMNELIAERTPIQGLCISPTQCNASALQAQEYIATRRTNDPNWYRQMGIAAPATVQRELLFVMAEILKQNHQAHLDHERLIAALTAIAIQNSRTNDISRQLEVNSINQTITAVMQQQEKDGDKTLDDAKSYMPYVNGNTKKNLSDEDRKKAQQELDKYK